MKKETVSVIIGVTGALLIVLLAFLIVWRAGIFGVSREKLEQDARKSQEIDGSWEMAQGINDGLCVMLFYDEDKTEYVYSVYLTKDKPSYGYFFREGGTYPYIDENVHGIVYEEKGIALLSLNADKVCRIVTRDSVAEETIEVDPTQPFALVLPCDCGEITMYDAAGNIVTLYDVYKE